jgi:pyrimidine operon attenuation protein/uracil phosphoribosyltransferase
MPRRAADDDSVRSDIDVDALIDQIAQDIRRSIEDRGRGNPAVIGIHTGGTWLAQHIHEQLDVTDPLGELNIAFYRDDFSRIGMHPSVEPSKLPFDVDGRHLILIDDILFTGRTVRAAMNEIFDYGRPASIMLAVLIDRTGRELPIQADIAGMDLVLGEAEHVKLIGPDPLRLEFCKATS